MRKLFFILATFALTHLAFAQAPEKMTFQAVIRNASNNLVTSSPVGMQISILQGSASGPSVYTETQTPTTNANGLATLEVGGGIIVSGTFSGIDWGNGPYFIKTETDPTGGTSYTITGTSELLSVPYALYAKTAESLSTQPVYLYLRKKATIQSIPSGSNTQIINYDVSNGNGISVNMATGVVTFNQDGIYMITAHTSFNAANPGRKLIWLNCTSTNWPIRIASNEMSNDANRITTSFLGEFNAGDQISMGVSQGTGVAVNCPNDTQAFDETMINIEKIR